MSLNIGNDIVPDVEDDTNDDEYENEIEVAGPKVTTPKEFKLVINDFGLVQIQWNEGGELPASLKGSYTDPGQAESAISAYKLSKVVKEA